MSTSTLPIAYLETDVPIVFWTDSTFSGLLEFYSEYKSLSPAAVQEGREAESEALRRCSAALYSSDWAAQSAVKDYDVDPAKVHTVVFGANIEGKLSRDSVQLAITKRSLSRCELLFIGKDWHRKGGDIAIDVAVELNKRGIPTRLRIVGVVPPATQHLPSCVEVIGFIDKANAEGRCQLEGMLLDATFLIQPSRAECYGLVFGEANSFGLPALASNIGGIPSAISPGVNGYLVQVGDRNQEVDRYCQTVIDCMRRPDLYYKLAMTSLEEYHTRLNWRVAIATAMKILSRFVPNQPPSEGHPVAAAES